MGGADKKGNCYAGHGQTNYLTRWTQANQVIDQLTIINKRREVARGISGWATDRLCPASSYLISITLPKFCRFNDDVWNFGTEFYRTDLQFLKF